MITEEMLMGVTNGSIPIEKFFEVEWEVLSLPNGWRGRCADPGLDNFFDKPAYRNHKGWNNSKGSAAHLNILRETIQRWEDDTIQAIVIFGSSVRIPKKVKRMKGILWWAREVEVPEVIEFKDVDVLVVTSNYSGPISRLKSKRACYTVGDGSCSWSHVITTLGFDINALSLEEFNRLLNDYDHECQVPNNVRKEGVLIAGELDLNFQSPRKVIWNEHRRTCEIK